MKKDKQNNLTSFSDHLNERYGKQGTDARKAYEQEFEAFKSGVLIQEMVEKPTLIQQR